MEKDSFGISGMAVDSALMLFFFGSAVVAFLYFWKKGRLDMDEEAKYQMMEDDNG